MQALFLLRPLVPLALALPLAACSGGPQQPSDVVDDKTAESPYLGGEDADSGESPSFTETAELPPLDTGGDSTGTDATETGTVSAVSADLSSVAGRWAPDEAACPADAGLATVISRRRYESPDRSCDVGDVIDAGNGAVTVTLACTDGESTGSELVKLSPADGQLDVAVIGGAEPNQTLVRCP